MLLGSDGIPFLPAFAHWLMIAGRQEIFLNLSCIDLSLLSQTQVPAETFYNISCLTKHCTTIYYYACPSLLVAREGAGVVVGSSIYISLGAQKDR